MTDTARINRTIDGWEFGSRGRTWFIRTPDRLEYIRTMFASWCNADGTPVPTSRHNELHDRWSAYKTLVESEQE